MLNPNLNFLKDNQYQFRIFALQGGTRSGKTYSALQWIINVCWQYKGLTISVARQTMPALRATLIRDFMDLLHEMDEYDDRNWNKTNSVYNLFGNRIEFFSLDEERKLRGRKRDILFLNEANEISFNKWRQLMNRTAGKVVIDYNPSDETGWIYDHVLTRDDCGTIVTTYLDNPFLEKPVVDEIELYKITDPNYWRVYGLGLRGISTNAVFGHWQPYDSDTGQPPDATNVAYGLDFGYNVPTAMVKCTFNNEKKTVWVEEMIYKTQMTNSDLLEWFKKQQIPKGALVYADAAEPDRIEEIYRAGWKGIKPADKNVSAGIGRVKSTVLYVSNNSLNLVKELQRYKWHVDKNNEALDQPIKTHDHAVDAMRYAIHTHQTNTGGRYVVF